MYKLIILWVAAILSCNADKIIIDTDAGGDDALAILLLLRAEQQKSPDFPHKIIAITCSYGNTEEENVEINVLKILTIVNRSDIPVYGGAKKPIINKFKSTYHYGKDGLGDFKFPHKIIGSVNKSVEASAALVELTKTHKDVQIIVLGPTTNVALATLSDPKFTSRVKKFWVMGSCAAGIGNMRPNVEFNFGADPEANFILLNSTTAEQLTLFPWDTGFKANISKEWRKNILGTIKSPFIDFLNLVERQSLGKFYRELHYVSADSMTVAVMLQPSIVSSTLSTNVEPVIEGRVRGSIAVDYLRRTESFPNARIVLGVRPEIFKELVLFYLTCAYIPC